LEPPRRGMLLATYNRALLPFTDFSGRSRPFSFFHLAAGFAAFGVSGKGTPTCDGATGDDCMWAKVPTLFVCSFTSASRDWLGNAETGSGPRFPRDKRMRIVVQFGEGGK
jgi:hypothetical protein